MLNKINEEIKNAMRARDKFKLNVLKLLKSKLEKNDKDAVDIISSHHKTLAKSQQFFTGDQLVDLQKELDIIHEFLPVSSTKEEYEALVEKHAGLNDFGQIMKAVKAEAKGVFNGGLVSGLIKSKLS